MKLSVIVPVYDEVATIDRILPKILDVKIKDVDMEIVIVDDFSMDGTREKLLRIKDERVKVFFHEKNKGKGSAVRTGLQHVTGDIVLFQDADMEYDPADYEKLILPIVENRADVVYGSRFTGKSLKALGYGRLILPMHFIGNKLLTLITTILYGQRLADMETGYKVFRNSVIKSIDLTARRFEMEPEITAKLLKRHIKIYEVPISYSARDFSEGKKITWKDGVKAAWCLIKYRFTG